MKIFEGIAASEGYALGKLFLNLKRDAMTVPEKARDPQWEISRFLQARERAASEISSIYHRALVQVGEHHSDIFKIHLALLQDYSLYKRLMLFYTQVVRSKDPEKQAHLADLAKRLREGKDRYPEIFSIPRANPNEYRKLKLFLLSPALYRAAMAVNDRFVLPARQKLRKRRKG